MLTVDGMMTIEHVTREINRILAAIGAVEAKAAKKRGQSRAGGKGRPEPAAGRPPNPAGRSSPKRRQGRREDAERPRNRPPGAQKVLPQGVPGFQGTPRGEGQENREKGHEKAS